MKNKWFKFNEKLEFCEEHALLKMNQFVASPYAINELLKMKLENEKLCACVKYYAHEMRIFGSMEMVNENILRPIQYKAQQTLKELNAENER